MKKLKKIGKCIFCDNLGNLSKEHLFAKWLVDYFPRNSDSMHTGMYTDWRDVNFSSQSFDERRVHQGHSGSKKLRVVCRHCNNGWMSALENSVRTLLPPLISAKRHGILPEEQEKLATWAVKTAMVAERFRRDGAQIPQSDRFKLMNELCPPKGWFVWIAKYGGGDWENLSIGHVRAGLNATPIANHKEASDYVQATTFGLGQVLFCVLGCSLPRAEKFFEGRETEGIVQVWPARPRSIIWPLFGEIGDREAYSLANFIRTSGVFDLSLDPGRDWEFRF